jgi:hypothetical protein
MLRLTIICFKKTKVVKTTRYPSQTSIKRFLKNIVCLFKLDILKKVFILLAVQLLTPILIYVKENLVPTSFQF